MASEEDFKSEEETFSWRLDTIPPEIFLHICSFLSAKFVINVLSQVCQKFHEIIQSDATWRMRIYARWPKRYPIIPGMREINWKEACIAREEHFHLWQNSGENMRMYHLKEAHFGSVNVVQILEQNSICASGGRDGALKLWNITALNELPSDCDTQDYSSSLLNARPGAHGNAWLWSIAYDNSNKILYTGGFDCNLKSWELENPSVQVTSYSLSSPILCLSYSGNTLASGCYGRRVSLFDPRRSEVPVLQHTHHKKPVICIVSSEKFIISGSEDKTIIVYDKAARKIVKTLELEGLPLCMSHGEGQLLVGDVLGYFHVIDTTHDAFELFQSYESGHKQKITGIQHSMGSIITCSTDKTIRVLEPNAEPECIGVLNCNSEISKISSYQTTLVSANTDDSITIWLPKEEF